MSRLPELLNELGRKADVYEQYQKDPTEVMKRYGLSAEEIKAMLAKDLEAVKRLSGMDNLKTNHTIRAYDGPV